MVKDTKITMEPLTALLAELFDKKSFDILEIVRKHKGSEDFLDEAMSR